jgi:hypothetical protein
MQEWIESLTESGGCVAGATVQSLKESEGNILPTETLKEEDLILMKYECALQRRTGMGKQSTTIKKTAEIFKMWSNSYARINDGVLYIYKGPDAHSPLTTSFSLDAIDWVRFTDSSDNNCKEFDISSGIDILKFSSKDRKVSEEFVDSLRAAMAQVKKVNKVRSNEDIKARKEAMIPAWIKKFDACEEGDRVMYISSNLDDFFHEVDYDEPVSKEKMLKVLRAIEAVSTDLIDVAMECKKKFIMDGKQRLDVLEMHFKLYHMRIVMEVSIFINISRKYVVFIKFGKHRSIFSPKHLVVAQQLMN